MNEFSKAFKEARVNTGLTQVALANLLNIPRRSIENWESGVKEPNIYVKPLLLEKLENLGRSHTYVVDFQRDQSDAETAEVTAHSSQAAVDIIRKEHGDDIAIASVKKVVNDWT